MEDVRGVSFDGSSPPFLGRERAAVGVNGAICGAFYTERDV